MDELYLHGLSFATFVYCYPSLSIGSKGQFLATWFVGLWVNHWRNLSVFLEGLWSSEDLADLEMSGDGRTLEDVCEAICWSNSASSFRGASRSQFSRTCPLATAMGQWDLTFIGFYMAKTEDFDFGKWWISNGHHQSLDLSPCESHIPWVLGWTPLCITLRYMLIRISRYL
jgi:hypothetical protein